MILLCCFIVSVDTFLVVGPRYPRWKQTSLVLFLFFCSISLSKAGLNKMRVPRDPVQGSVPARGSAGFNSRCKRAIRVQFPMLGGHVSESHLLLYSKPRGCLSRRCVTHENYCFLYCNWGLVSHLTTPDIMLNSAAAVLYKRVDFTWSP